MSSWPATCCGRPGRTGSPPCGRQRRSWPWRSVPFGVVVCTVALLIAPGETPGRWDNALGVAVCSVLVQVLAHLVGTGLGLLLRPAVLACLATIVLPIGLWLALGSVPALRPIQEWTTPHAAVQTLFSGRLTIVAWMQWSVVALLWGVARNALGAARLRRACRVPAPDLQRIAPTGPDPGVHRCVARCHRSSVTVMPNLARRVPTRFTKPLQTLVVICSIVFVIGTALQTFVIIDEQAMVDMMRSAGASAEEAAADAPGFLLGFRVVGCAYLIGNAAGLLARIGRPSLFWVVLLVNLTQAAGVVVIPPEVFEVTRDRFGVAGLLPSWVTDGGAAVLSLLLVASLLKFRTTWAHTRLPTLGDN